MNQDIPSQQSDLQFEVKVTNSLATSPIISLHTVTSSSRDEFSLAMNLMQAQELLEKLTHACEIVESTMVGAIDHEKSPE